MRVLHLASFNRWTGAAAPALAEVEALRKYGTDAHFAYVGGFRMEERLRGLPFAHPLIAKMQNPLTFFRSVAALLSLVRRERIEEVHAHLTWDHTLAVQMRRKLPSLRVFRTFHSRRTLRRDPFTAYLLRHTVRVCVVNKVFLDHPLMTGRNPLFTPPPVNTELFKPSGVNARSSLSLDPATPVLGVIGKVAPERGFEEAIQTFAIIAASHPEARLIIIGSGPYRPALQRLIGSLGVESKVTWAGYQSSDLPEYLRALNVLLVPRTGSDEGHRAVIEALACGVPAACYPLPGLDALVGSLASRLVSPRATVPALASTALALLAARDPSLAQECVSAVLSAGYESTARRLEKLYAEASQ
jgi:glycosyltransferase involved in cell wall biosynthesis